MSNAARQPSVRDAVAFGSDPGGRQPSLLHYFLGVHGYLRGPPDAWRFLSVQDMMRLNLVSKDLRNRLAQMEYTRCRDGKTYVVPYPGYPGLLTTPTDLKLHSGLFPHQLANLQAMRSAETSSKDFGALRGGVLGDAPGLGKTITVLALVLSTAGQRPVDPKEFWDEASLQEAWSVLRKNPAKLEDILLLLREMRQWIYANSPRHAKLYAKVARYVSPPYNDGRLPTIRSFQRYITRRLGRVVPDGHLGAFRRGVVGLKAQLDKRSRKLYASRKPADQRLILERRLLPTSATLIIVPDALLGHWYEQITKHIDLGVFDDSLFGSHVGRRRYRQAWQNDGIDSDDELYDTNNSCNSIERGTGTGLCPRGLVYIDGVGDLADIPNKSFHISPSAARYTMSHTQPWQVGEYLIVLTTFDYCRMYFDNESTLGRTSTKRSFEGNAVESRRNPFLSMRWLRLVVDEGHELGAHTALSRTTRFINEIAAERRWVMSGTPTTGDEDSHKFNESALDQVQRLLMFLRHPEYGVVHNPESASRGSAAGRNSNRRMRGGRSDNGVDNHPSAMLKQARTRWDLEVKTPFLKKSEKGRNALLTILRSLFVMHRKEDIWLPKPVFFQAEVNVSIPEAIEKVLQADAASKPKQSIDQFNDFLRSEDFQSMVDKAQAEYIVTLLKEARRRLLVSGGADRLSADVKVEMMSEETRENNGGADRRPVKGVVYSHERNNLLSVTEQLYRSLTPENIAEVSANNAMETAGELNRFRNNVKECKRCPVCQRLTDLNSAAGKRSTCSQILIEVYVDEHPERRYLIEPERMVQPINVPFERMRGEPLADYYKSRQFWRPGDLVSVDIRDEHPLHPRRKDDAYWLEHGVAACHESAEENGYMGPDWYFGPLPPIEDSHDRIVLRIAKWQPCGAFHSRRRWFRGPAFYDAPVEQIREDVFVLSLDAELSHGLDLSYVTHMFLLEPIDDAALLEQVTSRANRLGATGPVHIHTVNTFFKLSVPAQSALDGAVMRTEDRQKRLESTRMTAQMNVNKARQLSKVVCQYCYRQFESYGEAESHEATKCPRNPGIRIDDDRFHLTSLYREIRPPSALSA